MTLEHLSQVLAEAESDHAEDVERLSEMSEEELAYLANAETLEDPETDNLAVDCV